MINLLPKSLGAAGYIIILQIVTIGFFGLLLVGSQIQSLDLKQVVIQANETAEDTNLIIGSGNRTNVIVNEIRNTSSEVRNISNDLAKNFSSAEKDRLNQTKILLPLFQRNFIQVDTLVNATDKLNAIIPSLNEAINNVTSSIMYLSQNFGEDSTYLDREYQQYTQANKTFAYLNQTVDEIRDTLRDFNNTLN